MSKYTKQEIEGYLREYTMLKYAVTYNLENSDLVVNLMDLDSSLRKLQREYKNLYKTLIGVFVYGNPIQEQAKLMNVSKRQINRRLDDGLHILTMIMNGEVYAG